MSLMTVSNVTKTYGRGKDEKTHALKGISFSVNKGEFVGVMGPSGSGKSTLLNVMSTLDKPTSGRVLIDGQDVTQLSGDRLADFRGRRIGFIFQDFNLLETMTAQENIAVPLALAGELASQIERKVKAVARKLGIDQILDKHPAQISGGQKQRVAAARALISDPAILFADEPTGALDSRSAKGLLEMMSRVNQAEAVTILLVTHDPLSASYCNRILFVRDGEVHSELNKGDMSRDEFYHKILRIVGALEAK